MLFICLLLAVPGALVSANALNATEEELVAAVDHNLDSALVLLEQSVNINSGTMNFAGVKAVADLLMPEFEALGFTTKWVDGSAFNRAGHLTAKRLATEPESATKILLIGHLDTVFPIDSPFQTFKRLNERYALAPGSTDMKGGNVVILHALKALASADQLDRVSIHVVLTGDEEKRGRPIDTAIRPLIEAAEWADIAIGFEDGDGDPKTAVIARRGSSSWRLEVDGTPAHSSQIFREDIGDGALFEAARILNSFRTELTDEENLTFNPGVMVGGTEAKLNNATSSGEAFGKSNVIAQTAVVRGDLRAISSEQWQRVTGRMQDIVSRHLNGTSATIHFNNGYPPLAPTDGNRQLLELYNQASQDLGYGPVVAVDPRRAGAADISFTAGLVEMALDGIGLMGDGGHTDKETADLLTLDMQTKRAAVLIYRLASHSSAAP